jgi:uncharacterized membrane protein YphA (DoxX/SURF4 family)
MFDETRLEKPWWFLRLGFGIVPIVAGIDKFTNLLTDWTQYLSPFLQRLLPFSPHTMMHIVGVIEIVAGIVVLSRLTRIGAYIVSAWLLCIALQLLTTGHYFDIAARDVLLSVGAFALARMTEARAAAHGPAATRRVATQPAHA